MTTIDLAGQTFGLWRVVSRDGRRLWNCICTCGTSKRVRHDHLRSGMSQSCGCVKAKSLGDLARTHGGSKRSEYTVWISMKDRCTNKKHKSYPNYGGRGITVCDQWLQSFARFLADIGPRPCGRTGKCSAYTIERRNNDGNYEPGNCYWATWEEQARNRRPQKKSDKQ